MLAPIYVSIYVYLQQYHRLLRTFICIVLRLI